ncbi:MAG: AAA family ATPase [Bdellovibrionales bacterium]|nr:AAA family ATPase [Bdellovibrionales bacterium]
MNHSSKELTTPVSRRSLRSTLIGRDNELQLFEKLLEQIAVDQGQILAIVGPAGMGKSRTTTAFVQLARQNAIPVYLGTFTKVYQPYEAFRQIVSQITGAETDTLSRWNLDETETDFLRIFLEPDVEIERLKNLSEFEIRQGLFASVKKLIFNVAKTPVAFILEDVHWAGQDSQDLLEYLIEGTEFTRLLLVVAHRPEHQLIWKRRLNFTEVNLGAFDLNQIERFVRNVLDIDTMDSRVIHELMRVSHGNPLFLEEMLRHMLETDVINIETQDDGRKYLFLEKQAATIPETIHNLIESRLDRLPRRSKEALQWASVFGSTSDTDELTSFLQKLGNDEVEATLKNLFKRQYLVERSAFPKRTYRFGHDLFFDVTLKSVSEKDLPNYHKRIADFLCEYHGEDAVFYADRIAEHYIKSPDEISAIRFTHKAALNALKVYHYTDALYYFEYCYPLFRRNYVPDLKEEDFYVPYIETLLATGKPEEPEEAIQRWGKNEFQFSIAVRMQYLQLLTRIYEAQSNYSQIVEITKMISDSRNQDPTYDQLYFDVSHSRVNALIFLGRIDQALHEGLSILRELNHTEMPLIKLRLWGRLAYCHTIKNQHSVALDYLDKAEKYFSESLPPLYQIELLLRFNNTYIDLKEYSQCRRILSQALEIARKHGLKTTYLETLQRRAFLLQFHLGMYSTAIPDLLECIDECRKLRNYEILTEAKLTLIDTLVEMGAKEEATTLWLTKEQVNKVFDAWQEILSLDIQARLALFKGDLSSAHSYLIQEAALYKKVGDEKRSANAHLYALCVEAEYNPGKLDAICKVFKSIASKTPTNDEWLKFSKNITAMCLASLGAETEDYIDKDLDFDHCTYVDQRQLLYVWKIRYLDSKNRRHEASLLRVKYREVRNQIAKHVPEKYHDDFFTHPLYRVP